MSELQLVSVIAVCYNHAKYVVETLDSIKDQTYPNIELVIMDDCSTDNSVEVIQAWINENDYSCQFIAHKENQGLCKTLNEALDLIKGEYYQVLACDDIILLDKIQNQVNIFKNLDDNYAVVYSDAFLMDDSSQLLYGHFIQRHRPGMLKVPTGHVYDELILSNYIPAMSVLIRTDLIKKIGGYDEQLSYEDYDLWLRLSKKYKFYFSNYTSCKYRIHDNNMHKSKDHLEKELSNLFTMFFKHRDNTKALKKLNNLIKLLYKNKMCSDYKNEILSIKLNPEMAFFIKNDINFRNYRFFIKAKKTLKDFKKLF